MLASESCPMCGTRIEGKPTPALSFTEISSRRRRTPRWGFECVACDHRWIAEPISESLQLAAPSLEISVRDSRRLRIDRPYQDVEQFYPDRRRTALGMGWLTTFGASLISR